MVDAATANGGLGHCNRPPCHLLPGVLRAVEQALCEAWRLIHTQTEGLLADPGIAGENEITLALQRALLLLLEGERVSIPMFDRSHFRYVERGAEVRSWDGKKIGKKPDLLFRLESSRPVRANHDVYGLFTECKLIEPGKGLDLYCNDGAARFVKGEYAWLMCEAAMVAYVRDSKQKLGKLERYLKRKSREHALVEIGPERACCACGDGHAFETTHERRGVMAEGTASGSIRLLHVWLKVGVPGQVDGLAIAKAS
jgi:hypothetical protein